MSYSNLLRQYKVSHETYDQKPNPDFITFRLLGYCVKRILKDHKLKNPDAFMALQEMTDVEIQNGEHEYIFIQKYGENGALAGCLSECIPDLDDLYHIRDHNAHILYAYAILRTDPKNSQYLLEKYFYEFDVRVDNKKGLACETFTPSAGSGGGDLIWGCLCVFFERTYRVKLKLDSRLSRYYMHPENAKNPLIKLNKKTYAAIAAAAGTMLLYIALLV